MKQEKRLPDQKKLITEKDWDCLIILDACRFDYFKNSYKKYLEGNLKKVKSRSSPTSRWMNKTFHQEDFNDTVYLSGNVKINSKGITYDATMKETDLYFHKIVDVWDWGWNEKLESVPPQYYV